MTPHAHIFSSAADAAFARIAAANMRGMGWLASVHYHHADAPPDPGFGETLTSFPRRGKLNGSACVLGILRQMAASPGHIHAKLDADMLVNPSGARWLAGAGEQPRGFPLHKVDWIGAWAIPSTLLPAAIQALEHGCHCRSCPESRISRDLFHRLAAPEIAPRPAVQVWRAGRPLQPAAMLITLPSFLHPEIRARELSALFSL